MNIKKLKKIKDIVMELNDCLKTAPPMEQDAIKLTICYLIELMSAEVCDE